MHYGLRVAAIYDSSSLHYSNYELISNARGGNVANPHGSDDDEEN